MIRLVSLLLLSGGFLAACTSTTVDKFRQAETGIETDESIVILGRRQNIGYSTSSEFVDCVADHLTQGDNEISVIPEQEFMDATFPWFESRIAPLRTRDLKQLMAEQVIADKMDDFGIRYIVWLDWLDDANFEARIWDVTSATPVGTISTDANGLSYLPALVQRAAVDCLN